MPKRSDKEKDEVYQKWKELINMSPSELDAWSKNPDRLKASLNRQEAKEDGGIHSGYDSLHRIRRRVRKSREEWTDEDYDNAAQENGFNSRMLGNEPGNPVDGSERSKWEISLRNWGHDPSKSSSPAHAKYKSWKKKHSGKKSASLSSLPPGTKRAGVTPKTAINRMRAPDFRPRGQQWVIHEIAGVATEDWEAWPFEQKLKAVQEYYIQLAKKPSLSGNLREHLNAMKRWFNIQRRTHKPWRSRIQSFFKRVKRIQDQKKLRGEKEASQNRTLRRALVRLAYSNPELRQKLLPLILEV